MKIDGMRCNMCAKKVNDALMGVKGVSGANVDIKKGTAEVTHEGAKDEDLIRAVLDAGFRSNVKHGLFQ